MTVCMIKLVIAECIYYIQILSKLVNNIMMTVMFHCAKCTTD